MVETKCSKNGKECRLRRLWYFRSLRPASQLADDKTVRDGVCYRFGRLPRRLADGSAALVLSTNTTQSNASPPPHAVGVRAPQVLTETVLR